MKKKVPKHVVLFPDGNRRWAKKRGVSTLRGHQRGQEKFRDFLIWCKKRGVKILTVFGFSTENWKRSNNEVKYLMSLFEKGLSNRREIERFQREGVRVKIIGQKEKLSKSLQKVIFNLEESTKNNKKFHLNLAVSYGGRWDIVQALQKIIEKRVPIKKINENLIENFLSTAGLPAPDLVIRAGGERRFSNFLLWQAAYSELYFSKKLWPDFTERDLEDAFNDFNYRKRRYGGDHRG